MVPAAIVDDISFTFCGDDPPTAPLRCIAELHTNTEFPTITAFGISDKPPTWKKFREYKSGTRWIRWKNWKMSLTPKFCFTFSEDNKRVFLSFYRKDTSIKKQWLYPSIPTTAVPKPPFILCAPIEVEWPELADKSDVCDEIVDCEDLIIVNEDGSPATNTMQPGGSLDFKTTGACCGTIVWSTNKGTITQAGMITANCCPCGTITIKASCPACETEKTHNITVTGECTPLTIVNENGTPATDTILRNGSLDFKTTGACCGAIVWSVGAGTGQLGGSTITQGGLLHAGPTACGSLLVTALCPTCGTSDTQYVRVTDAGKWVQKGSCWNSLLDISKWVVISGNTKYECYYLTTCYLGANCPSPIPPLSYCTGETFPLNCTPLCHRYENPAFPPGTNRWCFDRVRRVVYSKWECV